MLGKLLKYEIKAVGRIMVPLYGVLLVIAAVFAGTVRLSMSLGLQRLMDRFALLSGILFAVTMMGVVIVMAVLTIQRFYKNLLGSEGYLMFTLPVTTLENILSKAITALLWISAGILVGMVSGFIIVAITSDLTEFMKELRYVWDLIFRQEQGLALRIVLFILMILVGIVESLCKVYAAIAVGHQVSNHRMAGAVLAYIAFGAVELLLTYVTGFRGWLTRLGDAIAGNAQIGIFIALGLVGIAVYGSISWYLLDRRLNLE